MIAGVFKGQKERHKFGLLREGATLRERDEALLEYAPQHPRARTSNLLIAGLWEDDAYYERVIQGRSNTLTKDQVRRIRYLASLRWGGRQEFLGGRCPQWRAGAWRDWQQNLCEDAVMSKAGAEKPELCEARSAQQS